MDPIMAEHIIEGPEQFQAHVQADEKAEKLFKGLYVKFDEERESIAGLRRRRQRASNSPENPIKTVSLIEEDGVLYWRDGIPAHASSRGRRRRRAGEPPAPDGSLVFAKEFPVLAPNKVIAAIGKIDQRLNPELKATLRSRLRPLRQGSDGTFSLGGIDVAGPFTGRTLLFVHGTFSNAGNMLGEFMNSTRGLLFLNRVTSGSKKYDRVVFFEHPTLCVSPVINALELGRALAGSTGQIDVIAHSRGGLVVRWWLEAFGSSLRATADKPVRAILAGAPLNGTSLAAPDKIQNAMSLLSNIGTFAQVTLKLTGTANPFLWVAGKLIEVIVSTTGALAKTPLVDGLVAVVPGLSGQSAVDNNHELDRLRLGPCAVDPLYYAVRSNFETKKPGWKFWRNFRKDRIGDMAADVVFPGANDLVVDTWSMTQLGRPQFKLAGPVCDFGVSDTVWHCNYFRQEKTLNYIATNLGIALN
jgi:pimeloyl-ACP methyl ester carboxylesterase